MGTPGKARAGPETPRKKYLRELRRHAVNSILSLAGSSKPSGREGNIMILGMTPFTFVHVMLSLLGILSGFVVVLGLLGGKRLDGWTALFLVSPVLASVSRVLFPLRNILRTP